MPAQTHRLLPLLIGIVLLSLIAGGAYYWFIISPATPEISEVTNVGGTINLKLTPASLSAQPNSEYSLDILIDTTTSKITGVAVELEYDPTKLDVLSVTQGSFLSVTLSATKIAGGKVNFTYAVPPDSGGIKGAGALASLKIKTKTASTRLSITSKSEAYAIGLDSNTLHTGTDTIITVSTAASSTPLASPKPSVGGSPTPKPSQVGTPASPTPATSAKPDSSPLASSEPSVEASTPTPTPSSTINEFTPESSTLPTAGIFELTAGTIGIGSVLIFFGLLGLLIL